MSAFRQSLPAGLAEGPLWNIDRTDKETTKIFSFKMAKPGFPYPDRSPKAKGAFPVSGDGLITAANLVRTRQDLETDRDLSRAGPLQSGHM
jgi:hypothetical protein